MTKTKTAEFRSRTKTAVSRTTTLPEIKITVQHVVAWDGSYPAADMVHDTKSFCWLFDGLSSVSLRQTSSLKWITQSIGHIEARRASIDSLEG